MEDLIITFTGEQAALIRKSFAAYLGYEHVVQNPEFGPNNPEVSPVIPNPETLDQFVARAFTGYADRLVSQYLSDVQAGLL